MELDSMALRLLSRRESRKDLWPRLITLLLLYFRLLYSLMLLQDGGFQKMLVFDRLGFPLLFWHSAVSSIDTAHFFDTDAYLV